MSEPRPGLLRRLLVKDGRLRPTLRVLVYFLLLVILGGALVFAFVVAAAAMGLLVTTAEPSLFLAALSFILSAVIAVLVTWLARRLLDRRSLVSLGLHRYRGWLLDLAFGVALGFALMTLIFLAEWALGWLDFRGFLWQRATAETTLTLLGIGLLQYVAVGFYEELVSRGYILQNLAEDWGLPAAVIASSVIFALLHSFNPNVSYLALFNLAVAGLFLASGYLVTRSLWLPASLHFSWNFFQGTFYGFPVSGSAQNGLLLTDVYGPPLVTGGSFGPEGGLLGLAAMLLGIGSVYAWGRWRSRAGTGREAV